MKNSKQSKISIGERRADSKTSFSQSAGLYRMMSNLNVSIAFTSYQSGNLYFLGRSPKGVHIHQCAVGRPMGLARSADGVLILSTGHQLIQFVNPLLSHERVNGQFDACYVPRVVHLIGEMDAHDVGVEKSGQPIFVNTRMNCLARPDLRHSFSEVWRPPFVSALVDEDRCHLNGLAMIDGQAAYVTAVSKSDTVDGWRDRRGDGGVVIDVRTGAIVCEGLSMPHSPRWHDGKLWVLNSGTGELGIVEGLGERKSKSGAAVKGKFVPKVFCPGFVRGLSFHDGYAIVGLSKPRYKRFEGLELDKKLSEADSEPWCGIQIIDLQRGVCAEWFRIDGAVGELYDVEVLPGVVTPMAIAPSTPEASKFLTWEGRLPRGDVVAAQADEAAVL